MQMDYYEEVIFVKKFQLEPLLFMISILFLISPRWQEMGWQILFVEEYGKSLRIPESYPSQDLPQRVLREYLQV